MIIKDVKGMYELKVDTSKKVVFERLVGFFTEEDMKRLHYEYLKIIPKFNGENWTKCGDLREFRASKITNWAKEHLTWCRKNGMVPGVIVVSSVVVEMQIDSMSAGNKLSPIAVRDMNEALVWLEAYGF